MPIVFIVNRDQLAAMRRGTVRYKHIAVDQSASASVYAGATATVDYAGGAEAVCGARVSSPKRVTDASDPKVRLQHLTCTNCARRSICTEAH